MNENLASIFSSMMNNPVSNWARKFGSRMAGGGDSVAKSASKYPYQEGIQDWSKIRATQRPFVKPEAADTDIYKDSAFTKLAEGRTVGIEDLAFPNGGKMRDVVEDNPQGLGHDYTNEGYDKGLGPNYGEHDWYDFATPQNMVGTQVGEPLRSGEFSGSSLSPGTEPVSVAAYEDRDPLAYAGETTDWTRSSGPEPAPFVDETNEAQTYGAPSALPDWTNPQSGGGELYPGHSQSAREAGAGGILGLLSGRHGKWIDQNKAKMRGYGIEPSHRTEAGELTGRYSSEDWKRLQAAMGG